MKDNSCEKKLLLWQARREASDVCAITVRELATRVGELSKDELDDLSRSVEKARHASSKAPVNLRPISASTIADDIVSHPTALEGGHMPRTDCWKCPCGEVYKAVYEDDETDAFETTIVCPKCMKSHEIAGRIAEFSSGDD